MTFKYKIKPILLIVLTVAISFCVGYASMYYFIQKRASYMSQGVFIDKNRDMDKFGIRTGKDFSIDNPYNYVPVDWLVKEVEIGVIQEKYKDNRRDDVIKFLKLAKLEKYSIYYFTSNITMWYSLRGVEGYCLVDKS